MIVIQRVLHTDRFALVILRLVLTTPGLSRQGSSKVGHRTSHLEALRAFVSSSQNTKISWLIIPKYIKIPCAKSIITSVHSHAMNLTEFHGTFGKANWEKLGKMGKNCSSEMFWSGASAWSITSPCRRLCNSPAAAFRFRWQRCTRSTCIVSPRSQSRGETMDSLSMLRAIHWKYTTKYITKDASNTILTARAATSARNWACQVKESHGFSTDLHRSPHTHTEHGPWPMAHQQDCDKRKNASLKFLEYLPCGLCLGVPFYNTCLWDSILCPYACEIPSPSFTRKMKPNGKPNGWPNDFMISLVPGGLRFALSTLSTLSTKICHLN